jgi:hypothetical protein
LRQSGQGEHIASVDDKASPLSLLKDEPRDHPLRTFELND